MPIHSGLRIVALVIAPAVFQMNIDRGLSERPHVSSIEPQVTAPGEVVKALGENLDRSRVAELILEGSDGTTITHIVEQRPDLIRFRVPRSLLPGAYRIVLVADRLWGAELMDQDIVLTVVGANGPEL